MLSFRNILLNTCVLILFASCSGESGNNQESTVEAVNDKYAAGKAVYDRSCIACHMKDGKGLESAFPPLTGSDYLLNEPKRAIKQVLYGSSEEMKVNGVIYNGIMPAQDVTEDEAIQVVNYILNAWGNDGGEVSKKDLENIKQ